MVCGRKERRDIEDGEMEVGGGICNMKQLEGWLKWWLLDLPRSNRGD